MVIVGMVLYFVLIRSNLSVLVSSLIAVSGPLLMQLILMAILDWGRGDIAVFRSVFNTQTMTTAAMQFILALFIFYKIKDNEDNFTPYIMWAVAGLIGIFVVVPNLASRIPF